MILTHNVKKKVYNDLISDYIKVDADSEKAKMMTKKYIAPRYNTDIKIYIKSINKSEDLLEGKRKIKLNNLSTEGVGFTTSIPLNENFFYEISLEVFNKNVVNSVIKIVRVNKKSDGEYDYGAMFCGLTNRDRGLIDTYGVFYSGDVK